MANVSLTHMIVAVNVVLSFSILTALLQYIFLTLHRQVCICHLCPQTWHILSRVDGIEPKAVLDVTVHRKKVTKKEKKGF